MKKGKKITGGIYKKLRKKKLFEIRSQERFVLLGEEKKKDIKIMSGRFKTVLLRSNKINLIDKKTHKAKMATIKNVVEVPSNKFLARKNILMKGALVETTEGNAKITNTPSQEGQVQGILV
jgi:small subunit ribosomal protein S8e